LETCSILPSGEVSHKADNPGTLQPHHPSTPFLIFIVKKQGFGVPIHEWFLDGLGERVHDELKEFTEKTTN